MNILILFVSFLSFDIFTNKNFDYGSQIETEIYRITFPIKNFYLKEINEKY
jgi:hypothetical protein